MNEGLLNKILKAMNDGYDVLFHKSSIGLVQIRVSDFRSAPSRHTERTIDVNAARMTKLGIDYVVEQEIEICLDELSRH